jgi:N-acetylglucosaminyldiphosphoundecaprenol N-acetyl-beta-D-mannosaminyltransferase
VNVKTLYKSLNILDVRVDVMTTNDLGLLVEDFIKSKTRGWFSYINIHTINMCHDLYWFKDFNDKALISYCDGEGIRWGAKILGMEIKERITLSDYIFDLAKQSEDKQFKLYFLGATQETIEKAVTKLKVIHPKLNICGYHNGYFDNSEENKIINDINSKSPDILIMGMGAPEQEWWIKENFDKLDTCIAWMGGGVFDFIAGTRLRSPYWVSLIGFEWLFRLLQEPRRLWRRYLIGIPLFFTRTIVRKIK